MVDLSSQQMRYAKRFFKKYLYLYIKKIFYIYSVCVAREVGSLSGDVAKYHRLFNARSRAAGGLERTGWPSRSARAQGGRPAGEIPAGGSRSHQPCIGG